MGTCFHRQNNGHACFFDFRTLFVYWIDTNIILSITGIAWESDNDDNGKKKSLPQYAEIRALLLNSAVHIDKKWQQNTNNHANKSNAVSCVVRV